MPDVHRYWTGDVVIFISSYDDDREASKSEPTEWDWPIQQQHGGGSDVSIEDRVAQHASVEMLVVDGFIEAVISRQTVSQYCQHPAADTAADTAADSDSVVTVCCRRQCDIAAAANKV